MMTKNPFDYTEIFQQFNPKEVAQKIQDAFKFDQNAFDFDAIRAAQEKNMQLLMTTNQAISECSQSVVKRQTEMLQQAMQQATDAAKSLSLSQSTQEVATKQADLLQAAYEKTIADSTEISEMAKKTQEEITVKVNERIVKSLEELKETISKIV